MVRGEHQHVLALARPQQARAQQRRLSEREQRSRLTCPDRGDFPLAPATGQPPEVPVDERQSGRGVDVLERLAVDHRERRPQSFVPRNQLIQTPRQDLAVEPSSYPDRDGNVVRAAARVELLQEPEPALSQ